ncbi:MAG: hypothetical protein JW991_01470 [Candidatus Pacebacteria bacterium]|nr:hypothetical protein [Candidatus Paceibacterota bacterium]
MKITRREFLFQAAGYAARKALGGNYNNGQENAANAETVSLSREECFRPFGTGSAEWQYVQFQYANPGSEQIGVVVSIGELTDPETGIKNQQLLVMRHNLETGETERNAYRGFRTFDELSSTYTFKAHDGRQLAVFSYEASRDCYTLKVTTAEFDSDVLDKNGLVLKPEGDLIAVSKDGRFPIASYPEGQITTNYWADNIRVERTTGETVGYGRRDSENLEVEGLPPPGLDIDHTWVHVCGSLADGSRVFVTAWSSQTGGDHKFADITLVGADGHKLREMIQFNEDDPGFGLAFEPARQEQEAIPDQPFQMAHGGTVAAEINGQSLFRLTIDGNPGQVIDARGMVNMVEAHGKLVGGNVLGASVTGLSAVWETTVEGYSTFLPTVGRPILLAKTATQAGSRR